jgi:hypothetical protein
MFQLVARIERSEMRETTRVSLPLNPGYTGGGARNKIIP